MRWILTILFFIFLILSGCLAFYLFHDGIESHTITGPFILLSCLLSLSFVSAGWWVTLYIARRQNTLNIINTSRLSETYTNQVNTLTKVYPQGVQIPYEHMEIRDDDNIFRAIRAESYILNYFEFITIGIKQGDFDEKLCREYFCGIFNSQLFKSENFIKFHHKRDPKIYEYFIQYAEKWSKNL